MDNQGNNNAARLPREFEAVPSFSLDEAYREYQNFVLALSKFRRTVLEVEHQAGFMRSALATIMTLRPDAVKVRGYRKIVENWTATLRRECLGEKEPLASAVGKVLEGSVKCPVADILTDDEVLGRPAGTTLQGRL